MSTSFSKKQIGILLGSLVAIYVASYILLRLINVVRLDLILFQDDLVLVRVQTGFSLLSDSILLAHYPMFVIDGAIYKMMEGSLLNTEFAITGINEDKPYSAEE